jgi:hypothetical protein
MHVKTLVGNLPRFGSESLWDDKLCFVLWCILENTINTVSMVIGQGFDRAVYEEMLRTLVPVGSTSRCEVKRSPRGCQRPEYDEVSKKHPTNLKTKF